ncbi:MAG: hypothetical protein AB7F43_13550 [Bacteriovoracia bacterium]
MKPLNSTLTIIALCISLWNLPQADAKTTASGRYLPSDHWLTCGSGHSEKKRIDPPFHKDSDESEVAAYVPQFSGSYSFPVYDNWQEWVRVSGTSCDRCGQTCADRGTERVCTCNTCSWDEKRTFSRHWSNQKVTWKVKWLQSQAYRQRRREWIANGKPEIIRKTTQLEKLNYFDPERPLEYFLFPGEIERLVVSNGWLTSSTMSPEIYVKDARHEYRILTNFESQRCDDRDYDISGIINTIRRVKTHTPNSFEFDGDWAVGEKDKLGNFIEEPGAFYLTDISARRYEEQNIFDHYKDTEVAVRLREIDRAWFFDRFISVELRFNDNTSVLERHETEDPNSPLVGVYEVKASDLFQTPLFHSEFHLNPGKSYEVCVWVRRKNNIYYHKSWLGFLDSWSDEKCERFTYNPPEGVDLRSSGRKLRDTITRIFLLPWW